MKRKHFTLVELIVSPMIIIIFAIMVAGMVGWGMNAYKLCQCDFEPTYKAECIRGIGVALYPVGAIAGYCDIEDAKE